MSLSLCPHCQNKIYLFIAAIENGSENDGLLVNERDSEYHKAVVSDS